MAGAEGVAGEAGAIGAAGVALGAGAVLVVGAGPDGAGVAALPCAKATGVHASAASSTKAVSVPHTPAATLCRRSPGMRILPVI
jgi:hypothetical protein